jgi:hypothetical protein
VLEGDLAQPIWEGARLSQFGDVAIGFDERFLSCVLRPVKIAKNGVAVAHGHVLQPTDDLRVRLLIAGLHTPHQCR